MLKQYNGVSIGDTVEVTSRSHLDYDTAGGPPFSVSPDLFVETSKVNKGSVGIVTRIAPNPYNRDRPERTLFLLCLGDKYTIVRASGITKIAPSMPEIVKTATVKKAPKGFKTSFDGSYIQEDAAVKIGRYYYEKGNTAVLLNSIWTVNNPDLIAKDSSTGLYSYKYDMCKLVVDCIDGFYQYGYCVATGGTVNGFEGTRESYVEVMLASTEVAIKAGFVECIRSGNWTKGFSLGISKNSGPEFFQHTQTKSDSLAHNIRYGLMSPTFLLTEGKKYTFGVEMETSSGIMRPYVYKNRLNVDCIRDGSVPGGEYVTGILQGDCGFNQLKKICYEAALRCTVDASCGVHVHVGGFKPNKEFSVFSYILGMKLEKEIMSMMPPSRRKNQYCASLPKLLKKADLPTLGMSKDKYKFVIDEAWSKIFEYVTKYKPSREVNKGKVHPGGRYGSGSREENARYKWLNFVPCNTVRKAASGTSSPRPTSSSTLEAIRRSQASFARADRPAIPSSKKPESSYTLEFRCHSATTNYIKVRNWVLICMAFVSYVENNKSDIINKSSITLADILQAAYGKFSEGVYQPTKSPRAEALITYVKKRINFFENGSSSESAEYVYAKPEAKEGETTMKKLLEVEA